VPKSSLSYVLRALLSRKSAALDIKFRPGATLRGVIWIELLAAGLGGGIVASLLESWLQRLRNFETGRLLIMSELLVNLISSQAKREETREELHWVTHAWLAHGKHVAPRLARRDDDTWEVIASFYGTTLSVPSVVTDPLEADFQKQVQAACDAFSEARLRWFEAVATYGPWTVFKTRVWDGRIRRKSGSNDEPSTTKR
jgi:hypothetical protein